MKSAVFERLSKEFGAPSREVLKVKSWDLSNDVGVVLQSDQPTSENAAYLWLPYPTEGQPIPETTLEYPGEAGRHSGTYPCAGLKRGEPALKLTIRDPSELDEVVNYIRAMLSSTALQEMSNKANPALQTISSMSIDGPPGEHQAQRVSAFINSASMPKVEPVKPRREAIPRIVQREVWQRDGGRCVECFTREKLCFDHIIPFSKGGSNSVRNLQLLCESCNLSKNNRI